MLCSEIDIFHSVSALLDRFLQKRSKGLAERGEIDPVLGPFRSRHSWLHVSEIQLEIDTVIDLAFVRHAEHFLDTEIIFERGALLFGAPGGTQIRNRLLIDRKNSHRRTVLRAHVAK